jgi:hypothetical protein
MENLFSERIDDYLFDVYSADRLEVPAKRDSRFFSLALLLDCAFPTEVYERDWKHRIVVAIGNKEWADASVAYLKRVAAGAELA